MSLLALAALLPALSASGAGAADRATGSVVVRLVTDPSPAGVSWSYSGIGAPFRLGIGGTQRIVSGLQPGTYRLVCTIANHDDLGQYGTLKVQK